MASVQQAPGPVQINHEKEKEIVSELVSEAHALLEKKRPIIVQPQSATVGGIFRNSIRWGRWGILRHLKCEKIYQGFGGFLAPPTDEIGGNQVGTFVHSAQAIQAPPVGPVVVGSKAAVIYCTIDTEVPVGYLLGWFKAQSSSELKVYVQAGNPEKLKSMEWPEIEKKIDDSGNKSHYLDRETGAFANAEIHNYGTGGNMAGLGANFSNINIIPL